MFTTLILVLHIFISLILIGIILLQQGKGADAGVAFGGGGSNTLFGAGGADTFLVRLTTVCAVLFFVTSITLAVQARTVVQPEGMLFRDETATVPATTGEPTPTVPAVDGNSASQAAPVTAPSGTVSIDGAPAEKPAVTNAPVDATAPAAPASAPVAGQ